MSLQSPCPPQLAALLGREVPVPEIERELRQLWEHDEARTRASLMNLVVYSEAPGSLLENSRRIEQLTREHACRAILVEINRNDPVPALRAWITAHCHLAQGRKTICCEQIAFYLTGIVPGRFRNTVFAHLSSDLPLVFWWQGELSDVLTERLVSVMDRLIVDSSSWADPAAGFQRIEDASLANDDLIVHDHAWTRTWQFRLGVASIFDDASAQAMLPQLTHVALTYHPAHRNSALQFIAWLAVQAGWRDLTRQPLTFTSAAGSTIVVELLENAAGPPLSQLRMQAGDLTASVTQQAGTGHVERRINLPRYQTSSLAPVDPCEPGELVGLQLARGGRNSLFHKILPRFRRMLAADPAG